MEKKLGKITEVNVGLGGYQDAMLGFNIVIGGEGWVVATHWSGAWANGPMTGAKWTNEDRIKQLGESFAALGEILKAAKVKDVSELKGLPVEATFDVLKLHEWRILKEVL